MSRRLQALVSSAVVSAACLSLSGCWVPQVIQGVRPEIFPSSPASAAPTGDITLESKIVAMGTRLIAIAKRTSNALTLSADLANHRQVLENHLYYNVKADGQGDFSAWGYADGSYSYYDANTSARYKLSVLNASGQPAGFDILGIGSYGQSVKSFPADVRSYRLELSQPDDVAGDTLALDLQGQWPVQLPLRGSFLSTLSGSGSDKGHALFQNMSLRVDGKSASDRSVVEGQIGFSAEIEGKVYNGFGTLDALGFVGSVDIQQNGVSVAEIVRQANGKAWDVKINGRISATGD